jgi:hypothetical protein
MAYDRPVEIVEINAIPVGVPGSGSIGVNGALTLTTALQLTYPNIWLYFPVGAVYSNSPAGSYFCQMTSTTLGTVYNHVLVGSPYIPTTLNPVVSASIGAYTAPTSAVNLFSFILPGGIMGANGQLVMYAEVTVPNNANTKIGTISIGGTQIVSISLTTTITSNAIKYLTNRGVSNAQISRASTANNIGNSAVALAQTSISTDVNQTVLFQGQLANAADFVVFEQFSMSTYFSG